ETFNSRNSMATADRTSSSPWAGRSTCSTACELSARSQPADGRPLDRNRGLRFCFLYATTSDPRPTGCMSTHYLLRLLVPALALVGCTQGAPGAPGDPSNPGDPQQPQGSNPPQLRYDQPLVYGHSGAPWITDLDGDGHLDMLVEPSPDPALTALYNRGDGSFKSADDGNFHVGLVADLNGDGRTDLVG